MRPLRAASLVAATAALSSLALTSLSAHASPSRPAHAAAAGRPYKLNLTYVETNHGRTQGKAQVGVVGHGRFSAKLGPGAAFDAAVIAVATGVPVARIAEGGSYVVQRTFTATGKITGTVVARFKAAGLGTSCLSYVEVPGKYQPGMSFGPMKGTIRTVGGTGEAARWRVEAAFDQTDVSGATTEQLAEAGSEHASTGAPKPMTAACRHVAKL